jgi:hypothetical protein
VPSEGQRYLNTHFSIKNICVKKERGGRKWQRKGKEGIVDRHEMNNPISISE